MAEPTYFAIIPANVRYDKSLKANEKLMYGEITCLANSSGYCTASNAYFAELYGVENDTVSRWITNLARQGYVSVSIVRDEAGIVTHRSIRIDKKIDTYRQKDRGGIDDLIEGVSTKRSSNNNTRYNNTRDNIKTIQKAASPKATLDSFDQFWESYPRKTAKANAQKSWAKINPDDIPEIMAGLEKYKRCKQWQDVNYIPHAATWLNGKRWNDEVITVVDRHTLPDRNDYDEGTKLTPEQKAKYDAMDAAGEDYLDGLF